MSHRMEEEEERRQHAAWCRLERYARWKQRRFPLHLLPHDTLHMILTCVAHSDVCCVLHVLYGAPLRVTARAQTLGVPEPMRSLWIHGAACAYLGMALRTYADHAFFYLKDTYGENVSAFVNWSSFTQLPSAPPPAPLVTYRWDETRNARVEVHDARVASLVTHCLNTNVCAVTLCLHPCYHTLPLPHAVLRVPQTIMPHAMLVC